VIQGDDLMLLTKRDKVYVRLIMCNAVRHEFTVGTLPSWSLFWGQKRDQFFGWFFWLIFWGEEMAWF
jgi:hypothetical protein